MPKPDLTDLSWERFDALVDMDPIALRDLGLAVAGEVERLRSELADLRSRVETVAEEYERAPRPIHSGTIAKMLREWVGA